MNNRNTLVRTLHDVGAGIWFGGALMGAVGLNGASKAVSDPLDRAPVASAGWARWAPVSAAAIGAHLMGASASSPPTGAGSKTKQGLAPTPPSNPC